MEDETLKVILSAIQDDVGDTKRMVSTMRDRLANFDKVNAQEHATIHGKLLGLDADIVDLKSKPGVSKPLMAAVIAGFSSLVGLVGYLVHTIH